MSKNLQAIRGMHDILPPESARWQALEAVIREWLAAYGYQELRFPIVESTELFKRTIGEVTDIVEKEMYTFADRNGDSLTLRPEGTAGSVRAGIEHGILVNQLQRFWYMGPMFRHERPQKGRYRQFHQLGIEAYGMSGPDIDAELILMTARLWARLGLDGLTLEINSLGTSGDRARYRDSLVAYMESRNDELDEDSRRRLYTNPLRILDSKNPAMKNVIASAPVLDDFLDEDSKTHFEQLCGLLSAANVPYVRNSRLVRGLDYYGKTVFEWTTDRLGAQGTVCAGGRYDGLVEQLGGKPTPAIGLAMGLERLLALLEERQGLVADDQVDAYMLVVGDKAQARGVIVAEALRDALPRLRLVTNCGGGGFKAQMKRADKSGARIALILAEEEVEQGTVSVKHLRDQRPQESVAQGDLAGYLEQHLWD